MDCFKIRGPYKYGYAAVIFPKYRLLVHFLRPNYKLVLGLTEHDL